MTHRLAGGMRVRVETMPAMAAGYDVFVRHGAMDELVYTPLAEIPTGETAEIRRVATSQAERLRYLEHSGLTPGTRVTVTEHQPFRGPITVSTEGHQQVIGHELAEQVLCVRPEPS